MNYTVVFFLFVDEELLLVYRPLIVSLDHSIVLTFKSLILLIGLNALYLKKDAWFAAYIGGSCPDGNGRIPCSFMRLEVIGKVGSCTPSC